MKIRLTSECDGAVSSSGVVRPVERESRGSHANPRLARTTRGICPRTSACFYFALTKVRTAFFHAGERGPTTSDA